jgi:phycocyanobilin:ferredoxin oxidoreductase
MSGWNFRATRAAVERLLLQRFALTPDVLPRDMSEAAGIWKDEPVTLTVRSWHGRDLRTFRTVLVTGPTVEIVNLLAVPNRGAEASIFGADLVSVRPGAGLVVADLSPLRRLPHPAAADPAIPAWAASIFSRAPLLMRVTPDTAPVALAQVLALARQFADAVEARSSLLDGEAAAAIARYMSAHVADERTTTMLAQMFGAEWARRFVETILYPVSDVAL